MCGVGHVAGDGHCTRQLGGDRGQILGPTGVDDQPPAPVGQLRSPERGPGRGSRR